MCFEIGFFAKLNEYASPRYIMTNSAMRSICKQAFGQKRALEVSQFSLVHLITTMARRSVRLMDREIISYDQENDDEFDSFGVPDEESGNETEQSDHDTDSEQEGSDDEEESDMAEPKSFSGKDGTVWNKEPNNHKGLAMHGCNRMRLGREKMPKGLKTGEDCFSLFIDDFVVKTIVHHTNEFIKSFVGEDQRKGHFRLTDETEINGWIGLNILIGTIKGGTVKQLWQEEMNLGCDLCICAMTWKRFEFLFAVIHFDDYETRSKRKSMDKFTHIREIFEHVVSNFQKNYTPTEHLCIDEQLLSFRGNCPFKQYMKSKPAKYGIKTWALVDAVSLYTYNLETYLGKPSSVRYTVSNKPEDVVLRLVEPIEETGRNITADNWFTSIPLVKKLADKGLSFVGTIRKNKRELPLEFKPHRKREVESSIFGFNKYKDNLDIALVSYVPKKNRAVVLVSTLHDRIEIDPDVKGSKPSIITFYNADKGGVDSVDQLCVNYNCRRRTKRWPMIVWFNLINVSGINALALYKETHKLDNNRIRYSFLQELAFGRIKNLIRDRMKFRQVPVELRQRAFKMIGEVDPLSMPPSISRLDKTGPPKDKQSVCFLCPKAKNSRNLCSKCRRFVCPLHFFKICDECVPKNI